MIMEWSIFAQAKVCAVILPGSQQAAMAVKKSVLQF